MSTHIPSKKIKKCVICKQEIVGFAINGVCESCHCEECGNVLTASDADQGCQICESCRVQIEDV